MMPKPVRPESSAAGRTLWAGLHLLDRQLVDHDGAMAGCIDDLELTQDGEAGPLYVSAIIAGSGALAYRFGARRLGRWVRAAHTTISDGDDDPTRIPFNVVSDIGSHITLGANRDQLGTAVVEHWVRDHLIGHIPGSRHAPE